MEPYIVELPEVFSKGGKLSFIENPLIPFEVKRFYWIYDLENDVERGGHCHLNSDRMLICIHGHIHVELENCFQESKVYHLNKPSQALFFPKKHWIRMSCSKDAIVVVAVSCRYEEDQYLKKYEDFLKLNNA